MSDSRTVATIEAQAQAVELEYVNVRGHRDVVRNLVERGQRPEHELLQLDRRLPLLRAAAKSLRWLARNESGIKAAIAARADLAAEATE